MPMVLQNIVNDYEAVKFTGQNLAEVEKLCRQHGSTIDWQTTPQGVTNGYLQTADGTVDIIPGIILAVGVNDQLFRIFPKEIGEAYPAKYKKVADEGRIGEWEHPQEPIPEVEPEEEVPGARVVDVVTESTGLTPEPTIEERMARLESLILKISTQ